MTLKWKRANKTEKTNETEIEQYDRFVERIQTLVAFDWLSERLGEKTPHAENVLEISRYFTLTSCCNTIGQSNNAFPILGFSLAGKRRVRGDEGWWRSYEYMKIVQDNDTYNYYSFKMFRRFWLAPTPRLILHNQLAHTIFGRSEQHTIDSTV